MHDNQKAWRALPDARTRELSDDSRPRFTEREVRSMLRITELRTPFRLALTVPECAEALGVTVRRMQAIITADAIPTIEIVPGAYRVPLTGLLEWMQDAQHPEYSSVGILGGGTDADNS